MFNVEIRDAIKRARLFNYEVADALQMHETSFSRKISRTELKQDEKAHILAVINDLSKARA
jgi:hypothetical protein